MRFPKSMYRVVILHLNGFTLNQLRLTESAQCALAQGSWWRKGRARSPSKPDFRFRLFIHSYILLNTRITGL